MEKKWCLLKVSDGQRGNNGKKKIYEITVSGNSVVTSWGMAEKPNRQSQTQFTFNEYIALQVAKEKLWEKLAKGYKLAYEV